MMKLTKGLILTFVLAAGSFQASQALEEDNCDIVCTQDYTPVCGSNGVTYSNLCQLNVDACKTKSTITVLSQGECAPSSDLQDDAPCPDACPFNYQPVCGSDGVTYSNECLLSVEACKTKSQISIASQGECVKETPCVDMCPQVYQPICGSDGKTYGNPCFLAQFACKTKSQVTVAYDGECTEACEVMCTQEYVPVCGTDKITYPNLCELEVSACRSKMKITVSHDGECEKDDTILETPCPGFCTMEYEPVCASDKKTYGNLCLLNSEACRLKTVITLVHQGECTKEEEEQKEEETLCPEMCTMNYEPVCGSNWVTYGNECLLRHSACLTKSQITVAHSVACEEVGCAMKCSSEPNPVCGSDGVTYLNQCMMLLASCEQKSLITVEREGICNTECSEICPKIYRPVCGSDGITYSNQCVLESAICKSLKKGNALVTKRFDGTCEGSYSTNAQSNSNSLSVGLGVGFGIFAVAAMAFGVVMYNKRSTSDPSERSTLISHSDSA